MEINTCISSNYLEIVKEAELKDMSYDEFLTDILRKEYEKQQENSRNSRIRMAQFPYKKYLEDLIVEDLPEDGGKNINF